MRPIFKTEMLFFQSRANLGQKMSFCNITHHLDHGIRKILVKGMFGNEDFTFHSGL